MPSKSDLAKAAAILGSAKTDAKTKACRENGKQPKKPRKRKLAVYPVDAMKRRWMKAE